MSNIYIQEPQTTAKVLLKTTVGDIDLELWARECPKASRNFIQLCLEGYFNGTIFHRVVKGFIVQGGDPNGDGSGGESIFGHPFKDEFHSRLRYNRRGLVGMANCGKDENGSQFFFTLAPTPELQNKNTLFGKIAGDTIFNMLRLEEGVVDHNDRPQHCHRIISVEVLSNPFNDIVLRNISQPFKKIKKSKDKGIKNFGLLSFGEEAENDELKTNSYVKENVGKSKSLHDSTDETTKSNSSKSAESKSLKTQCASLRNSPHSLPSDSDEEDTLRLHNDKSKVKEKTAKVLEEIVALKKQYQKNKIIHEKNKETISKSVDKVRAKVDANIGNHYIRDFVKHKERYSEKTKLNLKKQIREDHTLELLSKFRSKLDNLKRKSESNISDVHAANCDDNQVELDICGDDWLSHTLNFNIITPVIAKDASSKSDDWYDAFDPRNPLNRRKREINESYHVKRNLSK